jgi:hypothetical protein
MTTLTELQYAQSWERARAEAETHVTGMSWGARRTWQTLAEQILILDRDWSNYTPLQHPYIRLGLLGLLGVPFHSRDASPGQQTNLALINVRRKPEGRAAMTQAQLDARVDMLLISYPAPLPEPEPESND